MARTSLNAAQFDFFNQELDKNLPANILAAVGTTATRLGEAATTNAAVVKASKAKLFAYEFANINATTWRFVKLYDKATTPNPAADTVIIKIAIPPGGVRVGYFTAGLDFANGLGIAVTGASTDTDVTAVAVNEVIGTVHYR